MSETRISFEDGIDVIHKAGGKAVGSHFARDKKLDIRKEIDEMIHHGLDGLEVWHPDHNEADRDFLLSKVREYGLIASGGSDDHANEKEGKQYKIGGKSAQVPNIPETAWIGDMTNFIENSPVISEKVKKLRRLIELQELKDAKQKEIAQLDEMMNSLAAENQVER